MVGVSLFRAYETRVRTSKEGSGKKKGKLHTVYKIVERSAALGAVDYGSSVVLANGISNLRLEFKIFHSF